MRSASWIRHAQQVAALVRDRAGLALPGGGADVEPALRRVTTAEEKREPLLHWSRLMSDEAAFEALLAELTVGETYFFREPGQLDFIRSAILPEMASRRRREPVRVWSAGCASGEEAYSVAIILREFGTAASPRILGTDIARDRLARARRARYRPWSVRGISQAVLSRYFLPIGGELQLVDEIRSMAEFRHLNLVCEAEPQAQQRAERFDIVLCRNVLIYLRPEAVQLVAQRLLDSLAPEGWLVLGASDPTLSHLVECELVVTGAGVAYRRAEPKASAKIVNVGSTVAEFPTQRPARTPARKAPPASAQQDPEPAEHSGIPPADEPDLGADAARLIAQVRSLADAGQAEDATRACAAAIQRLGPKAELFYLNCVLLCEVGRYAEAISAARAALYLDRHLVVAHLGLGAALTATGDTQAARRAFGNALDLLSDQEATATVPSSGGETAGALADLVRAQVELLAAQTA